MEEFHASHQKTLMTDAKVAEAIRQGPQSPKSSRLMFEVDVR
jgi:hypothetical protein